ncbi:DUF6677 family protein [Natrialbaceae archaeon A-CW3]
MATENATAAAGTETSKNPILAAIISWIIPGLGHYYGGKSERGVYVFLGTAVWYVIMFVGFFLLFGWLMAFVTPLIHIAAGADAYFQVKKD